MQFKIGCQIAAAMVMVGVMATDALAERRDGKRDGGPRRDVWVQLGCQSVGFTVDRDVIRVGRREGRFKAIRLKASGSTVNMISLRVVYANGEPDNLPVRLELRPGAPTRAIDLRGRERAIDRIEMVYQARPSFRGRAHVCVEALD
jgi:hypothetical protein